MKKISLLILLVFLLHSSFAQVFTDKPVGKKNAEKIDSLKTSEYPYSLPIWGAKATKAGYELPYSAGLSLQYLWMKQDLVINNLFVGFNNGPLYNLDEVIRFDNSVSEAAGVNFRPDLWVFPFLNVYGIFAKSKPTTTVGFGLWVPDSTEVWKEVFSQSTKAEFDAFSVGFGLTPTIGVGGAFIALDMNFTWTDISALDEPAFSFIFDPRVGKNIKLKKPNQNIAVWVGGFRWNIKADTKGSLPLNDLFDTEELEAKIDQGYIKVEDAQSQVDTWWGDLTSLEQNNPVNKAKYETANRALTAAGNFLNAASATVDNAESSTVQYSLEKRPAQMWNFMVGGQYQHSKNWMLRGEYGFLGSRQHFFIGLQ